MPVETTLLGSPFISAWRLAAKTMEKYSANKEIGIISLQDNWPKYPTVPPPPWEKDVPAPDKDELVTLLSRELSALNLRQTEKRLAVFKKWLDREPNNLSLLMDHAVAKAINTTVTPNRHFLVANPLKGISLRGYGAKKRSWEALTENQLFALFAQDMPQSDRLLLSILMTTGMREDEAALLSWEQLKTDRNGIR